MGREHYLVDLDTYEAMDLGRGPWDAILHTYRIVSPHQGALMASMVHEGWRGGRPVTLSQIAEAAGRVINFMNTRSRLSLIDDEQGAPGDPEHPWNHGFTVIDSVDGPVEVPWVMRDP